MNKLYFQNKSWSLATNILYIRFSCSSIDNIISSSYYSLHFFLTTDKPQATLLLGAQLKPDDIKEGADAYFECAIKANPPVKTILWYHNVSKLCLTIVLRKNIVAYVFKMQFF